MTIPLNALDRIDAQIGRSLARLRAENASQTVNLSTDVAVSADRLKRLFLKIHRDDKVNLIVDVDTTVRVPVDAQDLEEMMGNILENAFKWSREAVRLTAARDADKAIITIEDDGPGISDQQRETALVPGMRLDTAVPGTGLGLSISQDLASAYGGELKLGESEDFNGLKVQIVLPLWSGRWDETEKSSGEARRRSDNIPGNV